VDTIQLELRRIRMDNESWDVAAVHINGEELVSRLSAFESPFAKREGHPSIAGAYSYLPKQCLEARMHAHDDELDDDDRVAVLECDCCGVPGCWPLKVRITTDDDTVTWSDFRQPHRSEESAAALWDYQGFGPFVFDRNQYEGAVKDILAR